MLSCLAGLVPFRQFLFFQCFPGYFCMFVFAMNFSINLSNLIRSLLVFLLALLSIYNAISLWGNG